MIFRFDKSGLVETLRIVLLLLSEEKQTDNINKQIRKFFFFKKR